MKRERIYAPEDVEVITCEGHTVGYRVRYEVHEPCGCTSRCGDDGDTEGPGVCKGLPPMPRPSVVQIVMVPRNG